MPQAPPPPQLASLDDPKVCPRENTTKRLAEILDEEWLIHVRGTPSSGKTTLALLLRDYCKLRGDHAVYLPGWAKDKDGVLNLLSECEDMGYRGITNDNLFSQNLIFILDEAQDTYHDIRLWNFIKTRNDYKFGPKFCLFSSYGSPAEGMVNYRTHFTPPFLNQAKRVSIILSSLRGSPDICLFYNEVEFEDAVSRYCSYHTTQFSLDKTARAYLFSITSGHPGAVFSMLSYIFKVFVTRSSALGVRANNYRHTKLRSGTTPSNVSRRTMSSKRYTTMPPSF